MTARSLSRHMDVMGIRIDSTGDPVVLLREKESDRYLSIGVSPVEAVSLVHAQNGVLRKYALSDDLNYVLPYSLICDVLGAVNIQLLSVAIVRLRRGTFFELTLSNGHTVSASPADSISLSLLTAAPVLVTAKILDEAGVIISGEQSDAWPSNPAGSYEQSEASLPAPSQPGSPFPPLSDMRRVEVEGVRVDTQVNKPVALLMAKQGSKYLVIRISASEGAAILSLGKRSPGPPFTHDLFCDVLKAVEVELLTVRITKLRDETHLCELGLSGGIRVKARVGDSLAFALRTGAEILVTADFLDDAGTELPAAPLP